MKNGSENYEKQAMESLVIAGLGPRSSNLFQASQGQSEFLAESTGIGYRVLILPPLPL